ncbi:efflux RND transporter periplasmic adaptor subunit [Nitratiruptor sp. SB155-2]|uniref:efflux RND transporter periplasmic adaptor subunit n=1 Tax=Nitratiruptor sp. (strain SB155-2) TaxID=387092 RepID=UPI0001587124|nr:efflux RND transporter periplasmic adaptor subunit [Nitratiruptor sp. SB155-2]BAF70022.1 heavy metal efflux pump, CzcB family [Nitratiruptor sp. SB155-2]
MAKLILFLITAISLFANAKVQYMELGKLYSTSAQVVTLKNLTQNIVTQIPGHIEEYFVKEGDSVKKGQEIARIKSFVLSEMTSRYLTLKNEVAILKKRYENAKALYKKGIMSYNDLAKLKTTLKDRMNDLASLGLQLKILGITNVTKPMEYYTITSHANGTVQKILVSVHTNVKSTTPLVEILSQSRYYLVAFLSVEDALGLKDIRAIFHLGPYSFKASFIKILPRVDEETAQAKLLFELPKTNKELLIGAFGDIQIESAPYKKVLAVKKSALTMLNGDWVVFLPSKEEVEPHVVKLIDFVGEFAVIEGLKPNQEYIDSDIYLYKSRLLKESIGDED